MSPRTGRPPKAESSRNKSLNIRLTADELRRIEECSNVLGKSRTDTLMPVSYTHLYFAAGELG